MFGRAKLNGTSSVEYRIDIQLAAWEHGKDTYRIRLSNGYDSGAQRSATATSTSTSANQTIATTTPTPTTPKAARQDGGW